METLVVVAQHRNQCYSRIKPQISDRFGSSPSRGLKGINCRSFEAGPGILPSPPLFEPKSPPCFYSEPPKPTKRSNPIAISPKPSQKVADFTEDFCYSELWAGPAYTNSPPPSSLPIPKFSLRQKRSISLELTLPSSEYRLQSHPRSAPPSPKRDSFSSATENLRRILHLDVADD